MGQYEWDNAHDLPENTDAACRDCGWKCSGAKATELEGVCPECGGILESEE